MSKYKCIIFDCDGVLVDSETIGNSVLVEMTNENGGDINLEYALKNFKGGSMQSCVDKINKIIPYKLPDNFIEEYRKRSFLAFRKNIKPIEGIPALLENLEIPFCVASSGPIEKIKLNLSTTGLMKFFGNNIFSCYEIKKWKPDPAIFLWAAKTMGFNPRDCLVIEDSITGVMAAKNGGFDVFGYTEQDANNLLNNAATATFKNMQDLNALLEL